MDLPGRAYRSRWPVMLVALILTACNGNGNGSNDDDDSGESSPTASAREASGSGDLLQGPLARSSAGDFVLENDLLRVIIQKPGRNWFGLGTYGGNIIDASAKNTDGSFNPDHMEEFVTGVNIENTANYTEVVIRNNGEDGEPAVICASGPDDLIETVNPSSTIRGLGGVFPDSADDRDLPVQIETCYGLTPDEPWVTLDTTISNESAEPLEIYIAEFLSGSGEVEAFQPNLGLGEAQLTTACPDETAVACTTGECDQCNYLAYTGKDGAIGVSYGFIHEVTGTSSFSSDGINILVLGQSVLPLVAAGAPANFEIPAQGQIILRRYFAVGDGTASSIADIRNSISGIVTGELSGTITSEGEPLANAQVAVFQTTNANIEPPARFMANHSRADAGGNFRMTLPPGEYEVQAHAEGYLYANDEPARVVITEETASVQDFDLPAPGYLQVSVTEVASVGADQPVPAKLQLVGIDPSPAWKNNILGQQTGIFADTSERLPYGVTMVEFIDRDGMSERIPVEPGEYQVVVSRGPRYSAYKQDVTISSGITTQVQASIVQVVETPQIVFADFHVHSIESWDTEVTQEERVATYLAEGMDFFTPSEHDMRVDFTDTLEDMDVTDLIGTAPSAEITPRDYGHFNTWPVSIDSSLISGGSVDWGREAAPGMDFPEYGSYGLSPAEIFDTSREDPLAKVVQINHIAGHFGGGGSGLAIDTGLTPPQSLIDLSSRRLDPNLENAFDQNFDALEIWIGSDGRNGIFGDFLGQNAGDWFNLLNQGLVRTAVANSDSHDRRITYLATRNLIASTETDPGELSGLAESLADTVAEGRVVGSNGPVMTINATATYVGTTRTAGLGVDELLQIPISSGTQLTVKVEISTAEWAQIDTVDFYINSQPELTSAAGSPARYGICANYTIQKDDIAWRSNKVTVVDGIEGATRNEISVTLKVPNVRADSWVVAIAHGTDGVSSPMFPVVPEDLAQASNQTLEDLTDDNVGEDGVMAYAFTNPLFIDVGNNGWEPPGVANAICSP